MVRVMTVLHARLAEVAVAEQQPLTEIQRLYALEGVLRRVARLPDRETLVLRGSLMTRLWARPGHRVADDIDFVATFAFDLDRAVSMMRAALAMADCDDGVAFVPELFQSEATWIETPFPGVRFTVPCSVGDYRCLVQIDMGFADPLVPPAEWLDYPSVLPELNARVLACRPELGCAWKIHGLFEMSSWRKKDLYDVYLILRNTSLDLALFQEAVRVAFESRQTPLRTVQRLLEGDFGASKSSARNWRSFRRKRCRPGHSGRSPGSGSVCGGLLAARIQRPAPVNRPPDKAGG